MGISVVVCVVLGGSDLDEDALAGAFLGGLDGGLFLSRRHDGQALGVGLGRGDVVSARRCYVRAAEEAEARGLRANELQAWMALGELEGPVSPSDRRLAEVVERYPSEAPMDLDLARARERLSRRS